MIRVKCSSINNALKDVIGFISGFVWYDKTRLKLFVLTLLVYSFSISHYYAPDESSYWLLTVSVTDFNTLYIDQAMEMYTPWKLDLKMGIASYDGHYYAKTPPGQSFIAIPFFLIGKGIWIVLRSFGMTFSYLSVTYIPMAMLSSISAALAVNLLYKLLIELEIDTTSSLLTSITLAFGTTSWVYGKTFYSHSLSMFLNFLGLYLVISATRYRKINRYFLAGIVIGIAITVRTANILLGIPILVYLIIKAQKPQTLIYLIIGTIPALSLLFFYNFLCFDDPLVMGYQYDPLYDYSSISSTFSTNPLVGGYGLLFSPGSGLFVYSPILILSIPGFYYFFKSNKEEAILFALISLVILSFYSAYTWWPGNAFGPRYLTDILPVIVLPLGKTLEKFSSNKYFWILFYILLGFSIFTQVAGVLTSPLVGNHEYILPGKVNDLARNGPDILIHNLIKKY